MANNDLFDDDEPVKPDKPKNTENTPKQQATNGAPAESASSPWSLSRRKLLVGAGAAAAAGVVVGTGATVAVDKLGGGSSSNKSSSATQAAGVPMGVPDNEGLTKAVVRLNVNGVDQFVSVLPNQSLAEVLRETLGMTGTKTGCDRSECGACTVLVDGVPHNSCSLLAIREEGKAITTVEGLSQGGTLSAVQQAFLDKMGYQCGFCTSGQMMQATALLKANPNADEPAIRRALSGNLCKCGAYPNILAAVQAAAKGGKA